MIIDKQRLDSIENPVVFIRPEMNWIHFYFIHDGSIPCNINSIKHFGDSQK